MSLEPLLLLLIIGGGLLSAVATIGWWVFVVRAAGAAAQSARVRRIASGGQPDLERLFAQIQGQIGAYAALPAAQRAAQGHQIAVMLGRMNDQMRDLDRLGRERYDLKASELSGMAASAGINWAPPAY